MIVAHPEFDCSVVTLGSLQKSLQLRAHIAGNWPYNSFCVSCLVSTLICHVCTEKPTCILTVLYTHARMHSVSYLAHNTEHSFRSPV